VDSWHALAGCASLLGIDDFGRDDGTSSPGDDDNTMPPPGDPPAAITISGQTVLDRGDFSSPTIPNTPLVFVRAGSTIAQSSTDASGNYAIAVPTGGAPLDGYLELELATDAYVPRMYAFDLTGDRNLLITAYSVDRISQLATNAGASQTTATGLIYLKVVDPVNHQGLSGATIDTGGVGQVRYEDDSINAPGATTTQTAASGEAWIFGVTGPVTVTARVGAKSLSRTVDVAAQSFTTIALQIAP
jgi:hypothetical protein